MQQILATLHSVTGHDFSCYKRSTIQRRLARRAQLHGLDSLSVYLRFLRKNEDDVQKLLRDLLITVTNFFREPQAFEVLETKFVPKLLENAQGEEGVRVWVPGCATGEEAYSIAMVLLEYAERLATSVKIQVLASDVSDEALSQARDGFYLAAIEAEVSEERLRKFFVRDAGGYRVRKSVREIVLFAHRNLLRDPPFSKLNLISCRNLLIYLNRDFHERLYEHFHYALLPKGYLSLGTSESAEGSELFASVDKRRTSSSASARCIASRSFRKCLWERGVRVRPNGSRTQTYPSSSSSIAA